MKHKWGKQGKGGRNNNKGCINQLIATVGSRCSVPPEDPLRSILQNYPTKVAKLEYSPTDSHPSLLKGGLRSINFQHSLQPCT